MVRTVLLLTCLINCAIVHSFYSSAQEPKTPGSEPKSPVPKPLVFDEAERGRRYDTLLSALKIDDRACEHLPADNLRRIINMYTFHEQVGILLNDFQLTTVDWCILRHAVDRRLIGYYTGCWNNDDVDGKTCRGENPFPPVNLPQRCAIWCNKYTLNACTFGGSEYKLGCPVHPLPDEAKMRFLDSIAISYGYKTWEELSQPPFVYMKRALQYVFWQPNPYMASGELSYLQKVPIGWPANVTWIDADAPKWRYNPHTGTLGLM